ncbi:MAG TPA: HAMP domain-containing sensor histidine kinase [Rectinemataceae bacterium]
MRLKTQFGILTAAVTLLPVFFAAVFFGIQQSPKDPRGPQKEFIKTLAGRLAAGEDPDTETMKADAEAAGMPLRDLALISAQGEVLRSTFKHLAQGSIIRLSDLTFQPNRSIPAPPLPEAPNPGAPPARQREPRGEFRLISVDPDKAQSPLVLIDLQPFWSRQDIRNRNLLFIGSFAFILFAVSGVISLIILRSISRAIDTLEKDTAIVATGDLEHEVSGSGNHEIFLLAKSINTMRLNLKDMLARRSRMLMGVSHDLKTPIALIQGYADALADGVASDPKTQAAYLDIIRDKARQLEDLTGDLIDFLKIGGDGAVEVKDVDLADFLQSMGKRFASDAQLLGRNFAFGFGEDMRKDPDPKPPCMTMNRSLAERALENLVTNAFKYTKKDGKIELRLMKMDSAWAFSVRDDGPGVDAKDSPFVFDAFYRASPSRSGSGHGFGLTIVKAVADLHGWSAGIGPRPDGESGAEAWIKMG